VAWADDFKMMLWMGCVWMNWWGALRWRFGLALPLHACLDVWIPRSSFFFLTDSVYKDALALVFVIIYSMHVQVVVAFEN
jgi:hypothetical protein